MLTNQIMKLFENLEKMKMMILFKKKKKIGRKILQTYKIQNDYVKYFYRNHFIP